MKQRIHKIQTSGGGIHVVDRGPVDGTPILFVHGFPLDHKMWTHQLDHFADTPIRFRLLCPDLLGCGLSDPIGSPTSMKIIANELAEMLAQMEVGPVIFCGLSMGGYVGWQFCKHHRQHVSCLIAANTRCAADSELVARGRQLMAQSIATSGTKTLADNLVDKLFVDGKESPAAADIHATILSTPVETIAHHQLAMAARPDMSDFIATLDLPTLVVAGRGDTITPPDEMREMAGKIPGAQFVCLKDAGHLTPLEQSDAFNNAVVEFLSSSSFAPRK